MDCDGEGAESGEQQQSDEDDEEDDGACSVDLRAENSRLHRDLEAMTKERDLLRHFGPIVTQLQEENATITANVHAISQQLARLLDAQKAPAGAAQSSLPAPLPRPSSRPQASAQPTAGADPGLLPPPPHRYLRTAAADPPRPPATRGLYIVLPLTCIPGATPELVEAAMTTTFQVPVTVRAIFPRKPQAERRSGDAGDSTPAHVAALAALGLVHHLAAKQAAAAAGGGKGSRKLATKGWAAAATSVWFVLYFASLVFIFPYLSVYYANKGLSSAQLGLIGSLRPWLSAVSSLGWSALADRYNIHRWVLVMNLSISTVTRLFLAFESSFGALLTTVLVSEFFGASVCVMVDAAVISACPQTSDYGKVRLWGAVGWGGFSSIAGLVIDRFGINAAFLIHGLLAVPCVFLGWGLLGQTPLGSSQPAPADISSSAETSRLVPGKLSSELDTTGNGRAERSGPVLGEKLSGLGPHTAASSLPPADGKFGRVDEVQSYAPHRTHVQHRPMRHTDTALELHTMSSPSGEESGLAHTQPLPNPLPLSPTGQEPHSHKAYRAQGGVDTSMHLAGPGAGVNDSATMHRRPDGNTGGLRHPGPACRGAAGEPPDGAHTQQRASLQLTHTGTTTRGTHTQAELHPQPGCLEKQQQQQQQRRQWLRHQQQQSVPCGEEEDSPLLQGAEGTQQGLSPTSRTDKEAPTLSFCEKLCLLGHNPRVWLFGAMSCLIGIGYGVIETWLFVYLQQLGGSRALMGVTLTVTCSLEIPFFYVQGYLLGKFKADTVMDMVLFAYVLRLSCYALLPWWGSPWAVLPVETLHGFTFAAAWGVGTVLAKQLAPEGLAATMQGLFQAMFMGVGYGLGALLTGLAAQYSPLQLVFAVSGAAMAVGWLVLRFGREVVARMEVGAAARGGLSQGCTQVTCS
ncbi:MAG: hypothetical protein WDW38_001614 [Sanguina aurantia]